MSSDSIPPTSIQPNAIPVQNAALPNTATDGRKSRKRGSQGKKTDDANSTDATDAPPKRGNPGSFSRKRVTYMKNALDSFHAYQTQKKRKRRGSGQSFWDDFFPGWWAQFPWRSPLKEDPPDDPTELAKLARDPDNDAEMEAKKTTVTKTEQKVIWWFSRQNSAEEKGKNPWKVALKELRTPHGPAPRRHILWQFYQSHADFKDQLAREFLAREYDQRPLSEHIKLRADLAKEMWGDEDEEVKTRIAREVEEEHAEAVAQYNEDSEGAPSADPDVQAEARRRFAMVSKPLLDLMQVYTGYEVTLLAARVDTSSGKPEVSSTSVHLGVTNSSPAYKDFSRADVVRYKEVMTSFSRFVVNSYLAEKDKEGEGEGLVADANPASTNDEPAEQPPEAGTTVADNDDDDDMEFPSTLLPVSSPPVPPPAPALADESSPPVPSHTPAPAPAPASDDPLSHMRYAPGPHLRAELLAMPVNDRENRIARMRILSPYEMEREENIASNKAMMISLGLMNATTWAGAEVAGRKRKGRSAGGKKKKQKGDKEASSADEDDEDDDKDEDDGEDGSPPTVARPARPTRGKGSQAAKAVVRAATVSNQWAVAVREQLEAAELGAPWKVLLDVWYSREESSGFVSPRESHKAKKRPPQVGEWVARGRSPRYSPSIPDPAKFGAQWHAWWVDINPAWRQPAGRLIQVGEGEWDGLDIPGANGFSNVLMCLKWWADAARGSPGEKWAEAVADVTWVTGAGNTENGADSALPPPRSEGECEERTSVGSLPQTSATGMDLSQEERAEMEMDPDADED
ncbi:hypothetical protein GGX14DRAFT_557803 [Mycena pura]|uniref:Uncharacterized protein n=1 Tax=Mycena pura TaxID=153505 RepID=A0AAD7E1R2_9AGAR|nr:hypothetical protein GGX14DRAFT_557803 [Mycena pura]